jgi:endonuclease YncB( thermonuclease family)
MKRLSLSVIVVALLLIGNRSATGQYASPPVELVEVTDIVDGDTIDVRFQDGTIRRVRYIGINTPESNEPCGGDATAANDALVDGKPVAMRRDVSETDPYDRLLRYVYVEGLFVNAALVADGWAESVHYPPDTAFADWFDHLESEAQAANLGCHPTGVFGGTEAQPQGVTVTVTSEVNLRGGPGTNYGVVGTLAAGDTATAVGRNGDWLALDDGSWIASWVVTVEGDITPLPTREAPPPPVPAQPQSTQPPAAGQPTLPPDIAQSTPTLAGPQFTCDCSKTCGAMASCEEAYFQLQQCGCRRRDGDGDGVPCESLCSGG